MMPHASGNQLKSDEGSVIAEFPTHWAACAAMIQITDTNFRSLGQPTPFEEGWVAGLLGLDPRACPFEKMTKEWHEWQSFHSRATEYRRCTLTTPQGQQERTMGKYSRDLAKRLRGGNAATPAKPATDVERLKSAAIMRHGKVHAGFRSHYDLRRSLGDVSPQTSNLYDVEGFLTTADRFVERAEAQDVALAAGQLRSAQGRPLLSSDIDW